LHSNKHIKKVSYYKLFKTFLREWFFPKKWRGLVTTYWVLASTYR
jgi:hypothetical protein